MSQPNYHDLVEVHQEIQRLLSANPDLEVVGLNRGNPQLPQYATIEIRIKSIPMPKPLPSAKDLLFPPIQQPGNCIKI